MNVRKQYGKRDDTVFKKRLLITLVFGVCVFALLVPAAPAAPAAPKTEMIKLRIGAGHAPQNVSWTGAMEFFFVPEVNKRLAAKGNKYQIDWVKGYGGTVAKLGEVLEAVEANLLDVGWVGFVFEPSKLPMHNIGYYVPFSTGSAAIQNKIFGKLYRENDWMMKDFERFNQKLLGISSTENYNMFINFDFKGTASLKGKKIGGAGANLFWLDGTGAVGVQSSIPETYTNLQTNLFNGAIQPTASVIRAKVYEVAKFMLKVDFGAILVGGITINLDTWKKLPKEVQDVMIEVGKDYEVEQGKLADKGYEEQLEVAKKSKMQIVELTPAEKEAWAKMLPSHPANFVKKMEAAGYKQAGDFMKAYLKALNDEGIKLPRKWM